jgi:hypothetical protein
MTYPAPTLFGVVYASRLFREIDESSEAYQKFFSRTAPRLDLKSPDTNHHAQYLLDWLNK